MAMTAMAEDLHDFTGGGSKALESTLQDADASHGFGDAGIGLDTHVLGAQARPRLTEEEKLAREVQRRREAELERRTRIFDAKVRTVGVDKETLDAQIAEKQAKLEAERMQNLRDDIAEKRVATQIKMLDADKNRGRRDLERHCKEYSIQNLHFEARREFDLNDPKARRNAAPARVGDEDPRCGPSSMQQFNGEDLMKEERVRQQRAAAVNFMEQQKYEKAMYAMQEKMENEGHANNVASITGMRGELEDDEANCRRTMLEAQQQHNLQQAAAKAELRRAQQEADTQNNAREIEYHNTSHFMAENGPKHNGEGRVRRDAFKGSSREERAQVAAEQRAQADKNAAERARQQQEDQHFMQQAERTRKQIGAMDGQKSRARQAMLKQMAEENQRMAEEQKNRQKEHKQLYTNEYSDDFFGQFGTSTR
mmetsp:Transcript_98199/g.278244  ORF Transcript_98199/g.278244 Transcript_98199/m.278244 type:complete len:424 (+) Transcript_98199:83-1354(+)